jgi:hypothetical protein
MYLSHAKRLSMRRVLADKGYSNSTGTPPHQGANKNLAIALMQCNSIMRPYL